MPTDLRYDRWFLPFSAPLGLGPGQSDLHIENGNLHVKMGWGFRATIPLGSIKKASIKNDEPNRDRVYSYGVHGWRGRWLVNGSAKGIVELTLGPPVRAHVAGVPVTVRTLWVSVTDPDALIAAAAPSG